MQGSTAAESDTRPIRSDVSTGIWRPHPSSDYWWYSSAVVVGAALFVTAAINQPYNQNEIEQMLPYGSNDVGTMTGGTRQPPLDPLLGALLQHVLGEGQLRQRLVPILAGVGTLVLLGLFLRRLGLGYAGAFALWMLATQPLMVRYSAYTRPYALPVFLSMLFIYAGHRWLVGRRKTWLVVAVVAACLLPLSRVPEPNTFLVVVAATLCWFSVRGDFTWRQTAPLAAAALAAVAGIGIPLIRSLSSQVSFFDPSPSGVASRFGHGVAELTTAVAPWMAGWFPWWPFTVAIVVAALVIPQSRRRIVHQWGWVWWPLLVAPVVFLLAYHFASTTSFAARPYRDRYAYFFLPALSLLVASLAAVVRDRRRNGVGLRVALGALLGAAFIAQLPATADVLTTKVAPDFVEAGETLTNVLPPNATVVYATPARLDWWRQEFMNLQLDKAAMPSVADSRDIARHPRRVHSQGPVYVLVLDGVCANSVFCDKPAPSWDHHVPGWAVSLTFDRFTLYAPTAGQSGRGGVVDALTSFAEAFGPAYGMNETYAAAGLLKLRGQPAEGRALIHRALTHLDPTTRQLYREYAGQRGLDPFRRSHADAVHRPP